MPRRHFAALLAAVAALLLTAAPARAADGGPPADGTWSDDLATGGSSALDGERLESGRLTPGRYRIEVVNYAAPPGTAVELALTFFDSGGTPGA